MHITEISLYSSKLAAQKHFYAKVLSLPVQDLSENAFMVKVGDTKLTFTAETDATPYHFAINIPCNQIQAAHAWLKRRVPIVPFEGNEIVDFENWNANSLYFYDADDNILELIARKNLQNDSQLQFSEASFLHVSEIGLPTTKASTVAKRLMQDLHLPLYDGDKSRFSAIGDEQGMFVVLDKTIKKWLPNMDEAFGSKFTIVFETATQKVSATFNGELLNFSHPA